MGSSRSTAAPTLSQMEHELPHPEKIGKKHYEHQLRALQIELLKLQRHVNEAGEKVVIIFEGRDAAGKGGSISRFLQYMNPRSARTVALPKPNETELGQWYFQRYVAHLPTAGELVLLDRSWYNRAGVERVMGFCTAKQYGEFFRQVPGFEQALVESGIHLFKFWFTVSREHQAERFAARQEDPLKQWKFSPMDAEAQNRWDEYSVARDDMLAQTDSSAAPWTVVNSNEKKRARLESIRHVLHSLDYEHKHHKVAHAPDPMVVQPAADLLTRGF